MQTATMYVNALIERSIAVGLPVLVTLQDIEREGFDPGAVLANLRVFGAESAAGDFHGQGPHPAWRVTVWA